MSRVKTYLIPIATLAGMIVLATLLGTAINSVPRSLIHDHAVATFDKINADNNHPLMQGDCLYHLDKFTDRLMCNITMSADDSQPLRSAMLNPMHLRDSRSHVEETTLWVHTGQWDFPIRQYGRYWHGYEVPLTTLLLFTDYSGIRVVNFILYFVLMLAALWLTWRRCSPAMAIALLIPILITASPILVPLAMQYIGCHIIMFAAIIVALLIPREKGGQYVCAASFFVIVGAVTAFIDLLTTPVITLGVPAVVYIARHGKEDGRLRLLLTICASWGIAYAVMWSSKWLLANMLTGVDVLSDALYRARYRSIGDANDEQIQITTGSIVAHYASKITPTLAAAGLAALGIIVAVMRLAAGSWQRLRRHAWMLAIAALPLLWFSVMTQHTIVHFYMTWRALMVTIFALTAYIFLTVRRKELPDT